jgi:hypothetical protein
MATMFLMSHHGLRRDVALLARSLREPAGRAAALAEEWTNFRGTLHGHHQVEDATMFPGMRVQQPQLKVVFDILSADHRRIDPLLQQGDAAFARFGAGAPGDPAAAVVAQLHEILYPHLLLEERQIVPLLRPIGRFEAPVPDEATAEVMAGGFAWSAHGVAPDVLERVFALLPAGVVDRLPAARTAYEARFSRAFGPVRVGASRTAVPDWV